MATNNPLDRIAKLSGKPLSELISFCRNNAISYVDLEAYYMKFAKLPAPFDCAMIRKSGQAYIKSL